MAQGPDLGCYELGYAGYDSPYHSGLWAGTHGTCTDKALIFDAFHRMGVRGTELEEYGRLAEANDLCRKYGIYVNQFTFSRHQPRIRPGQPMEDAIEKQAERNRDSIRKYPHTKRAMVFHESGEGPFPMELVGGKTVLSEEELRKDRLMTDLCDTRFFRDDPFRRKGRFGLATARYPLKGVCVEDRDLIGPRFA